MEEELQKESQGETIVKTETNTQTESAFENLPRLEDLLKSEKDVKVATELKGVEKVKKETAVENRTFARVEDEKKILLRRRLKIITSVYVSVVALMLTFVGVNLATLVMLNKDIDDSVKTYQVEQTKLEMVEKTTPANPTGEEITITLNTPRDYSNDEKELTFWDKLTIVFKNMFG